MSAFLGKIHYWLYNKIQLQEKLIENIAKLANSREYNSSNLLNESYSKFGFPIAGKLEDEINHSNIHGWLQERIISVESRLAYVTTELLKEDVVTKEDISDIFYQSGESTMWELGLTNLTPEEAFKLVFDYMLEGMPCDRVSEVIETNESEIIWKTTRCIHSEFWNKVQGDVSNYYDFRTSWINGFLGGVGYKYSRTEEGLNSIKKV